MIVNANCHRAATNASAKAVPAFRVRNSSVPHREARGNTGHASSAASFVGGDACLLQTGPLFPEAPAQYAVPGANDRDNQRQQEHG